MARHYCDENARLKSEILLLKADKLQMKAKSQEEKEKVCHFWRNHILEGKSCSGKMVHMALNLIYGTMI